MSISSLSALSFSRQVLHKMGQSMKEAPLRTIACAISGIAASYLGYGSVAAVATLAAPVNSLLVNALLLKVDSTIRRAIPICAKVNACALPILAGVLVGEVGHSVGKSAF